MTPLKPPTCMYCGSHEKGRHPLGCYYHRTPPRTLLLCTGPDYMSTRDWLKRAWSPHATV